ncbi:VIT1/CCC1 family predicted Fe2+/Mn2+ transporter [Agrococcus sp. UYP33]
MTNASQPGAGAAQVELPAAPVEAPDRRRDRSLLARGLLSAGIATAVNVGILAAATAAGASTVVAQGGSEIAVGLVPVLVATFVPLALATVVAWLVAKRWPRAIPVLAWAGLAVAAVSTIAPLTGALDAGTGIALALMHLVAGASWFAALRSQRRR